MRFRTGAITKLVPLAVGQLDDLRRGCFRQPDGLRRERGGRGASGPSSPRSDSLRQFRARSLAELGPGLDPFGDERCVVLDPAEQRRSARVLPFQPEEIETGQLGHAAPMAERPFSRVTDGVIQEWSVQYPVAQMTT